MSKYFALDLETTDSNSGLGNQTALEPWRVRQGRAEIMSLDLIKPDGSTLQIDNSVPEFKTLIRDCLVSLKGQTVWGHNIGFDIAWLIATLQPQRCGPIPKEILDIDWRDSYLLMKWMTNGQKAERLSAKKEFSLSLAACVEVFLPEHPQAAEFVDMKSKGYVPQTRDYWLERGSLDVIMTKALADKFAPKLPESSRRGFLTECGTIVAIANSWINGIKIDRKALEDAEAYYGNAKKTIATHLRISDTVFTSPKKLSSLLFNDLRIQPVSTTPSGNPGTSREDLVWIRRKLIEQNRTLDADIVSQILEAKESSTIMSKYVKTAYEALDYTNDGFIYGAPRLFGTYTGRMTYSNSTLGKFKTGIALHQIPRKAKLIRAMMTPPEGFMIYEADAEQQESRLMALRSGDPTLLSIFKSNMNFHSNTGANIASTDYEEFELLRALEDGDGPRTEERQMGKLTNLSCNYRISGKALASQSFVKYGKFITPQVGQKLVDTFNRSYPGVPAYWREVVQEAKHNGYTSEFGGRRFSLDAWATDSWSTESSAVMFPIQGSGASMKEIAILELRQNLPEMTFALDLHDASFGFVPIDTADQLKAAADDVLNNIDYSKYWGFKPDISLPYESKMGHSFKDVK